MMFLVGSSSLSFIKGRRNSTFLKLTQFKVCTMPSTFIFDWRVTVCVNYECVWLSSGLFENNSVM
jgi:hypothetical protein